MLSHETLIKTCDWQWTEACKRRSYCYSKNTAIFVTLLFGSADHLQINFLLNVWLAMNNAQARPLSAVQLCCTKCQICIPLLYSQLWMPRSNGLHWCELSAQHWVHQRVSLYVLTAAKSKPDLQHSRTDFLIVFEQNLCVCHWDNDFPPILRSWSVKTQPACDSHWHGEESFKASSSTLSSSSEMAITCSFSCPGRFSKLFLGCNSVCRWALLGWCFNRCRYRYICRCRSVSENNQLLHFLE